MRTLICGSKPSVLPRAGEEESAHLELLLVDAVLVCDAGVRANLDEQSSRKTNKTSCESCAR